MRIMRILTAPCCAAALIALAAPVAHADEWNKKTYLTFSAPVQVPGATLQAGTYLFQLADPDDARHVIEVASKDGTEIYSLFMTIPDKRAETPSKSVVMFDEAPAGAPPAIKAWWYPGEVFGEEFVYPRNQAVQIARANHASVLSTTAENATGAKASREAMNHASVGRVSANGEAGRTASSGTASSQPAAARPQTPPAQQNAQAASPNPNGGRQTNQRSSAVGTSGEAARRQLPRTASDLELFELLSAFSIAAALGLRLLRKRLA